MGFPVICSINILAPFLKTGIIYFGMTEFIILEENNLLSPQLATAGPKYFIAGPANPFKSVNI